MENEKSISEGFISPDGVDRIDLSEFKVFRKLSALDQDVQEELELSANDDDEQMVSQLFEVLKTKPEPQPDQTDDGEEESDPEPEVRSEDLLSELEMMVRQVSGHSSERKTVAPVYDPYNEQFNGAKTPDYDSVPQMPAAAKYKFDRFKRK